MLKAIEWILVKLGGKTVGYGFNLWDWDILTLGRKWWKGEPLTEAEDAARLFLEDVGNVLDIWQPQEKWEKPTGDVLNEHRNLH